MYERGVKIDENIDCIGSRFSNFRHSIKQRLHSLRERSKNESLAAYFPMDFINEEFSSTCSMTTEVLKNDIKQKLFDAVKYLGVQNALQQMEKSELNVNLFMNSSKTVRNLAFLWAAYVSRLDYLQVLHELGADARFSYETDKFNALHLSALSGSVPCCDWLLSQGCDLRQETSAGLLPVHYAALGNSKDTIQFLIERGSDIPHTVLHSAVRANSVECVEFLLPLNIGLNTYDKDGMTPLHIAADQGSVHCLKLLSNHSLCRVNIKTDDDRKYTALHLAAENGYDQCIKILAEKKANVDETNSKKETALHLACKMQYLDCVEVLLKNHAQVNVRNNDHKTPLHCAVAKSRLALPIVEKLTDWQADVNAADWYGFTPLHIAALNELEECVEYLIMKGANVAAKTKAGLSALKLINRKTPICVSKIPKRLDLSLAYNAEQSLKFSFRDVLTNSQVGEVGFLYALQRGGQPTVLQHPICRAFLHLKWEKVRPYYLLRVAIAVVVIIIMSLFVMTASIGRCCGPQRYSNCTPRMEGDTENIKQCTLMIEFFNNSVAMQIMKVLILIKILVNTLRIIFSLAAYKSARHYIAKPYNILELIVTVFIVVLCSGVDKDHIHFEGLWQNVTGAITILFSWVYLMIMVGQMPSFGTYVSMFTKVLEEFAKLLIAYFCLLIGFTITLCVLFPNSGIFENPIIGFVKVMAMMTGELNLDDLVSKANSSHFRFTALLVLALFIVFVTVVLMNLLVGIAVHDVEGLHKTADLNKLVHQTQLIYFLELACFNGYFPKKISDIFQNFLYVWPKMYRVVIYVRPLNPQEKRLPKDIMEEGLKIALDRSKARSMKNNPKQDLETKIDNLEKEVKKFQTLLNEIAINVKNLTK